MNTKKSEIVEWPTPFELGRQWAELAEKTAVLLSRGVERRGHAKTGLPVDPLATAGALAQFTSRLLADPVRLAQAQTSLMQAYADVWFGSSKPTGDEAGAVSAPRGDRRFKDEAWRSNKALAALKDSYTVTGDWLRSLVADQADLPPDVKSQVEFCVQQYLDAIAPTNFAATNPEVMRKTLETSGQNLVQGLSHLLDDLATGAGQVKHRAPEVFELGVNIAATPGAVVFRNELMELIQYEPTTPKVRKTPLLLVPPWVNKYYLFDLQPKSSFVKWAVDQGYTVFVISWVNPDASLGHKDFADYWLEGPMAAMDAIEQATGERKVNIYAYCLGGTLTTAGLAYLARRKIDRVASATLVATMTDYERLGNFEPLITPEHTAALEKYAQAKGRLDSADLTRLFSLLRANDLIWSPAVSSYLLAEEARPSDMLYWFADGIGMPAKMLGTFLRDIALGNGLAKPDALSIDSVPIDVRRIKTPLCFISLREDHVVAWENTYQGAVRFTAPKRFILGGSGHNAGTINPPDARKHGYWTNDDFPEDPSRWFAGATRNEGSWWPEWSEWLKRSSGPDRPARPLGEGGLPALEPAPGSYARHRA
jgi:polyhydroxyalkanoate synthase